MKFLRKLISPKKSKEETQLEWNENLKNISDSLINHKIEYPVIILCHVPWDFRMFKNSIELINESIFGHWGLDKSLIGSSFDEKKIVIDSIGKVYKISHEHYYKETKTGFSYPSIIEGSETLENLKNRIIEGSTSFISDVYPERENEIKDKQEYVISLTSIKEVITYVGNYMEF